MCSPSQRGWGYRGEALWDRASSALLPGLYTAYSAHLHRDKALLKRLLKVQAGGGRRRGGGGVLALWEELHWS